MLLVLAKPIHTQAFISFIYIPLFQHQEPERKHAGQQNKHA